MPVRASLSCGGEYSWPWLWILGSFPANSIALGVAHGEVHLRRLRRYELSVICLPVEPLPSRPSRYDPDGLGFAITGRDDPAAGSFVSRDPMPGLNRFAYGGGNPVGNVDLSGMCYEQSAYNKIASEKSPLG